nr:hypothetical protein [Tanacetum cinerariifolium]
VEQENGRISMTNKLLDFSSVVTKLIVLLETPEIINLILTVYINKSLNTDADVAFDVKENENDVHVSPSGSDKTDNKKHDEKAKGDDRGKSPVVSPT